MIQLQFGAFERIRNEKCASGLNLAVAAIMRRVHAWTARLNAVPSTDRPMLLALRATPKPAAS